MKKEELTPAKWKALELAKEHGSVVIGKGFGMDTGTKNAISSGTYRSLVTADFLTPHDSGDLFTGEVFSIFAGKTGFLTHKGKTTLEART